MRRRLLVQRTRAHLGGEVAINIKPVACPSVAPATRTWFAPDPIGVTASLPDGHLYLLQEWLGPEIAARIDPGPAATNASRPHMKIVALICRHDLTIFAESNLRKSRGASSYKIAVTRTRSNKMQGPSSRSLRAPSLSALRFLDKLRRAPARLDQRCSCASRCNSKNQCADKRFSMANSSSSSRTQVRFILPS